MKPNSAVFTVVALAFVGQFAVNAADAPKCEFASLFEKSKLTVEAGGNIDVYCRGGVHVVADAAADYRTLHFVFCNANGTFDQQLLPKSCAICDFKEMFPSSNLLLKAGKSMEVFCKNGVHEETMNIEQIGTLSREQMFPGVHNVTCLDGLDEGTFDQYASPVSCAKKK
eukprot:923142_1